VEEQQEEKTMDENSGEVILAEEEPKEEPKEESHEGLSDPDEAKDLDFILDIPLEIAVELGRTKMLVNDLLKLCQGSVVELTKMADAPMDVYVNRKLFARGEVVVVNEKFGIRLTDIISPIERVKSLG
jgi:flagellar motor switch protein FliN/FliY